MHMAKTIRIIARIVEDTMNEVGEKERKLQIIA